VAIFPVVLIILKEFLFDLLGSSAGRLYDTEICNRLNSFFNPLMVFFFFPLAAIWIFLFIFMTLITAYLERKSIDKWSKYFGYSLLLLFLPPVLILLSWWLMSSVILFVCAFI
jgi:hypothetical protein